MLLNHHPNCNIIYIVWLCLKYTRYSECSFVCQFSLAMWNSFANLLPRPLTCMWHHSVFDLMAKIMVMLCLHIRFLIKLCTSIDERGRVCIVWPDVWVGFSQIVESCWWCEVGDYIQNKTRVHFFALRIMRIWYNLRDPWRLNCLECCGEKSIS